MKGGEHMRTKLPSPALVLASLALLVSLSGTAIAAGAVPLAKKALFANNAGKLQGKTATQVAAIEGPANRLNGKTADEIAATPGPASSATALVSTVTAPFSLAAQRDAEFSASCPAGTRVVAGGYSYMGNTLVLSFDSRPTSDTTWTIYLLDASTTASASGSIYAICLK